MNKSETDSPFNGKQLSYAELGGPIFLPGIGQITKVLTNKFDGMNKAIKMTLCEPYVVLEVTDKGGKVRKVLVPYTSFTHMVPVED